MLDKRTEELMNRGWADMQARLDTRGPASVRRKRRYAWMALALLLLVSGCGGWWLWQRDAPTTAPLPRGTQKREPLVRATPPAVVVPAIADQGEEPENAAAAPVIDIGPSPAAPPAPVRPPARVTQGAPRSRTLTVPPSIDPPVPAAYGYEDAPIVLPAGPTSATAPAALTSLPLASSTLLPTAPAPLPLPVPNRRKSATIAALPALEAGLVASARYPATGAYVQADWSLPLGPRTRLRTGIGARWRSLRSHINVPTSAAGRLEPTIASGQSHQFFNTTTPSLVSVVLPTSQTIQAYVFARQDDSNATADLQSRELAFPRIDVVSDLYLPLEIDYRITDRWHLQAGASLRYALSSLPSAPIIEFYGSTNTVAPSGPERNVLRRWNGSAQLGTSYRLSPRWSVRASAYRDLDSRFANFVRASERPVELQVGMRYRWR